MHEFHTLCTYRIYGIRNNINILCGKYVFILKQTSLGNFVRSTGLLCSKFGTTLFEVRGQFVLSLATSYKMHTYVPVNFIRSPGQLQANFGPTSNELRANFVQTSAQLWTTFKPTSCEVRKVWTSHVNIISVVTVLPLVHPSIAVMFSI